LGFETIVVRDTSKYLTLHQAQIFADIMPFSAIFSMTKLLPGLGLWFWLALKSSDSF